MLALVIGAGLAALAVLAIRVEGASMRPTFSDGERILLRPFTGGELPDRFAAVVGRFTEGGPAVVKRVIAVPGDRVRIQVGAGSGAPAVEVQPGGQGPWLRVDNPRWTGQWGDRPRPCCQGDGRSSFEPEAQTVPPGVLFLLGDNPARSEDSRAMGWAPIALIDGVVGWRLRAWFFPTGIEDPVILRPPPTP